MSKKLGKFDKLSRRIDLFKNILDGRLAGKSIVIDRQEGFKVQSKWENLDIPLDKLSSGEQHQLVLIFELLFEISPKSLILIDEPELSLHITWQKNFIADLVDIIQLNDFDVVLATHSPQLVGKWWHLTEELGDVEE
jgi:predicted ATP-binding protein involved in virulence